MRTKRTLKSFLAAALVLIISVSMLTAASAASNDKITWSVDGETVACNYHSALDIGTNAVEIKESGYYCFDISDLENGYYSAKITNSVFEYFSFPQKSGSEYLGWGDGEYIDGTDYVIFNRNDKVDFAVAGAYGASDSMKIELEYLGENIESIKFDIDNSDEFLLHYDICEYHYFSDDEYRAERLDAVVTFTGGKTLELRNEDFFLTSENELKKGENTVSLEFAGCETEQVLNIAYLTDYISGVEVTIPENAAAYMHYNGITYLLGFNFEEMTVCFADGSKQTREFSDYFPVTLANGKEIIIEIGYDTNLDARKAFLTVSAGDYEFNTIELNTKKASFADNLELFTRIIGYKAEYIASEFESFFGLISSGGLTEIPYAISSLLNNILFYSKEIIYETGIFIAFMF